MESYAGEFLNLLIGTYVMFPDSSGSETWLHGELQAVFHNEDGTVYIRAEDDDGNDIEATLPYNEETAYGIY